VVDPSLSAPLPDASKVLRVSRGLAIPLDELDWRFSASGGPGGQHANTANTKVEVRFDIEASPSLGPRQRERLLETVGPSARVVASDRRSQAQNRELALERLRAMLVAGLVVPKYRVATKPTRSSKRVRVADKRRQGDIKRQRRRPGADD
jgi:ribosome-associated protein